MHIFLIKNVPCPSASFSNQASGRSFIWKWFISKVLSVSVYVERRIPSLALLSNPYSLFLNLKLIS